MEEKTKHEYRRLAATFYARRLGDQPPSPKRLADALADCAGEYRPAYWRRLRNAVAMDQREKGYDKAADRVASVRNPVTAAGSKPKARQPRCRRVALRDHRALIEDAQQRGDRELVAALTVAAYTGVRPGELPSLRVYEDGSMWVQGIKKRQDRGADRVIQLSPRQARKVRGVAGDLPADAGAVKRLQSRLYGRVKELFPRRKPGNRPSLYSYRHQLGSDLRASGMDRREIAYIMGHRNTSSVDKYGNKRSGGGSRGIQADASADLDRVKVDHEAGRSQQPEPAPEPAPGPSPGGGMRM